MSTDDTPEDDGAADDAATEDTASEVKARIEEGADRAVQEFDEAIVELLSWVLDTETRARIYVHLRQDPDSTSEEIAEGTGLYPSTVREALAELHEEGKVERRKRESDGAGNNPYEYSAMAPTDLVQDVVDDVQGQLNTVFNLDRHLGASDDTDDAEPVTISVEEAGVDDEDAADEDDEDAADEDDEDAADEDDDADDTDG